MIAFTCPQCRQPLTVPDGAGGQAVRCPRGRLVAVKRSLSGPHGGEHELTRCRLEGEGRARRQHPNIVQVYEVGEHEGRPFFALEFVEGGSLAAQITGTPPSPERAAALVEVLA